MREVLQLVWGNHKIRLISYSGTLQQDYIDGVILMQYTGLRDRLGVEIYEGDILESDRKEILQVKWGEGSFDSYYGYTGWVLDTGSWVSERSLTDQNHDEFRIVGNIYENPDLIKEGKE